MYLYLIRLARGLQAEAQFRALVVGVGDRLVGQAHLVENPDRGRRPRVCAPAPALPAHGADPTRPGASFSAAAVLKFDCVETVL